MDTSSIIAYSIMVTAVLIAFISAKIIFYHSIKKCYSCKKCKFCINEIKNNKKRWSKNFRICCLCENIKQNNLCSECKLCLKCCKNKLHKNI